MRLVILVLVTQLLCLAAWPQQINANESVVAYSNGGVLYIADLSGKILRVVKAQHSIGTFAFTPDMKEVLFAPLGKAPHYYGGQLYLLTLSANRVRRLTRGLYYDKRVGQSDEVYSDPDISPDGKRAVFAIHGQSTGDIVEASGPFAIVTLETGKVRVLGNSLHSAGWFAYANDPHWSPDGRHILLNYEDGTELEDLTNNTAVNLSPLIGDVGWSHALGWLGSQCVVYIAGKDYMEAQSEPARFLNLKTQRSGSLSSLLKSTSQRVTGLVAVSRSIQIRKENNHILVETPVSRWEVPGADASTYIRILPSGQQPNVPETCE
jgi:hypothetical protein